MYEPTGHVSKLTYLKERVEEFEKEYAQNLTKLTAKEKDIAKIGELRFKWFEAVSTVDDLVGELNLLMRGSFPNNIPCIVGIGHYYLQEEN